MGGNKAFVIAMAESAMNAYSAPPKDSVLIASTLPEAVASNTDLASREVMDRSMLIPRRDRG